MKQAAIDRQARGAIYGITTVRNGILVGSDKKTPRQRVKDYLHKNPGSTPEQISCGLRMTPRMVDMALQRLSEDKEIYTSTPGLFPRWHVGEFREAPRGLINSIWDFAQNLGSIRFTPELE